MADKESPWKEVCERKLDWVFLYFFVRVHRSLDWTRDYESLDGELRKLAPDAATGKRIADRLIKAYSKKRGEERYFHLEVQGKKEKKFPRRMYVYNYRGEDRFGLPVVSMALLVDDDAEWRPNCYVSGLYPVRTRSGRKRYLDERRLRFLTVKVLDYKGREAELEAEDNPMGLFVLAHLEAGRTRKDEEERARVKLRLLLRLREKKMAPEDKALWARFIDWFLQLPKAREEAVTAALDAQDKEQTMTYVTSWERIGLEKGLEKGLKQGVEQGRWATLTRYLKQKFGDDVAALLPASERVGDAGKQEELCDRLFLAADAEAARNILASIAPSAPTQ